jgi:hypothetical protein
MSEPHTSSNGTAHGYSVEARMHGNLPPLQIGRQIFDSNWRGVQFDSGGPCGVKASQWHRYELDACGLLSYEAAQALRWWLLADAPAFSGIETRLVKHTITYAVSAVRVEELCETEVL